MTITHRGHSYEVILETDILHLVNVLATLALFEV